MKHVVVDVSQRMKSSADGIATADAWKVAFKTPELRDPAVGSSKETIVIRSSRFTVVDRGAL